MNGSKIALSSRILPQRIPSGTAVRKTSIRATAMRCMLAPICASKLVPLYPSRAMVTKAEPTSPGEGKNKGLTHSLLLAIHHVSRTSPTDMAETAK